eukprot:12338190-Alexandrium_andersonii.AAC.1
MSCARTQALARVWQDSRGPDSADRRATGDQPACGHCTKLWRAMPYTPLLRATANAIRRFWELARGVLKRSLATSGHVARVHCRPS